MHGMFPTPVAELIKLYFALDKLFILARPVVYTLARLTREFD